MAIGIGSFVKINRPHLWSGCSGQVVKQVEDVDKKRGKIMKWRVRIPLKEPTKYNDCCHTDSEPQFLEEIKDAVWESKPIRKL